MNSKKYIVVTPCKNEEDNLFDLAISLANQTIKPSKWFIIDDCSDDHTPEVIKRIKSKHPWISSLRLEKNSERKLNVHISEVVKAGYDFA